MHTALQTAGLNSGKPLRELVADFRSCDRNADGSIDFQDFKTFLRDLGAGMSDEELRIGFREVDADRDGHVDFKEFMTWWNG